MVHACGERHINGEEQATIRHLCCHLGSCVSRPALPPKAISGSVALLKLGSVLMCVTCVTSEGHTDACGLGCHLRPC